MTAARPLERLLRTDRMPHIFCPGCGLGTTVNCFLRAVDNLHIDPDKLHVVSGIGCSGRVAGYINTDSFHTTHGRALPFATGLSLAAPDAKVVVYSGDGDLFAIGGNHLMHAARRNVDMTVICVNNYTYGMTGGQVTPTTPHNRLASTTPFGNFEHTFNLPHLVDSCGANFVARWTVFHVRQLTRSMMKALQTPGFSFIEILSPCPTLFLRKNRLGSSVDLLEYYRDHSKVVHGANTADVSISLDGEIIVGNFVDRKRSSLRECYEEQMRRALGDDFVPFRGRT